MFAAQPVPLVDLSAFAAEFPTNAISTTGCQAAYDSPQKEPPASCRPFPITMEVRKERPNVSSDGARALEIVLLMSCIVLSLARADERAHRQVRDGRAQ